MEETLEKLQNSSTKMEEAEKEYKDKEEDVNAQSRRVLLLEEEVSLTAGQKYVVPVASVGASSAVT
jgi:hypothetical protein